MLTVYIYNIYIIYKYWTSVASLEVLEVSDGAGEDGLSPHRHCDVGHLAQEPRLSLLMVVTCTLCTIVATYKKDCWVTGITCTTGILRREFPMIHSIYKRDYSFTG